MELLNIRTEYIVTACYFQAQWDIKIGKTIVHVFQRFYDDNVISFGKSIVAFTGEAFLIAKSYSGLYSNE